MVVQYHRDHPPAPTAEQIQIAAICKTMPGWDDLVRRFDVFREPTIGYINSLPHSFHVMLDVKEGYPSLVDEAR